MYSSTKPFTSVEAKLTVESDSHGPRLIQIRRLHPIENVDSRALAFRELALRFKEAVCGIPTCDYPTFINGLRVRKVLDAARKSIKYQHVEEVENV